MLDQFNHQAVRHERKPVGIIADGKWKNQVFSFVPRPFTEWSVDWRNQGHWRRRSVHADGQGRTCQCLAKVNTGWQTQTCDWNETSFLLMLTDLSWFLCRMSWLWRYVLFPYHSFVCERQKTVFFLSLIILFYDFWGDFTFFACVVLGYHRHRKDDEDATAAPQTIQSQNG